jgi:dsRNA-specific ribonuclease
MYNNNSWSIHPSYKKNLQFQQLEFFGDKIIAFEISKFLLLDKRLNEGQLSIVLSSLVCRDTMSHVGKFLIPHTKYTGEITTNMIASTLEAWVGYKFFQNPQTVSSIIYDLWKPYMYKTFQSNVKNIIQEYAQKYNHNLHYDYKYVNKKFICDIYLNGLKFTAEENSKKKSSELAARKLCEYLNIL